MKRRISRGISLVLVILLLAIIGGVLLVVLHPDIHIDYLWDQARIKEAVAAAGPWGPLVYIFMQVVQVIIAPLPGSAMALAAGYIYGAFWATVLSMIGSTLGFLIVFLVAKKYGRPLMHRFVDHKKFEQYERLATSRHNILLYVAFLVPILPDPLVGYAAGLAPLSMRRLIFIVIVARIPGVFTASYIGSQAAATNYTVTTIMLGLVLLFCIVLFIYRKRLEKWLLDSKDENLKEKR